MLVPAYEGASTRSRPFLITTRGRFGAAHQCATICEEGTISNDYSHRELASNTSSLRLVSVSFFNLSSSFLRRSADHDHSQFQSSHFSHSLCCTMYASIFLTTFLPLLALASPWPQANVTYVSTTSCNETSAPTLTSHSYSSTTTLTVSGTLIVTPSSSSVASTTTSLGNSMASSGPSATNPVGSGPVRTVASEPFSVAVLRRNATIDLSPMNARSFGFYVGGETASYCPRGPCPPGDETVFREQCSMVSARPDC